MSSAMSDEIDTIERVVGVIDPLNPEKNWHQPPGASITVEGVEYHYTRTRQHVEGTKVTTIAIYHAAR